MTRGKKAEKGGAKVASVEVDRMPLAEIIPAAYNPRTIDEASLAGLSRSVDEFGYVEPLIYNKRSGRLVSGHQRLKVLARQGVEEVDVVMVDLDDTQEKALNVTMNNRAIQGEWDHAVLSDLLGDLKESTALEGLFGDLRMDVLLEDVGKELPKKEVEQDEVPDVPKKAVTKRGDLWELGRHRLLCGDCQKDMGVLFDVEKYNLLITDPPYGVSYASKNEFLNAVSPGNRIQTPIEGDHKSPGEMFDFWLKSFSAVRLFADKGSCYYVTGPQGGDLLLLLTALRDSGFPLRHMLIWAKNVHVLGRSDYNYQHEPIIYGWVEGAGHKFYGEAGETSLWKIAKTHQAKLHPTMKPMELYARAMRNSSKKNEVVCDPFVGSGTMLIVAEELERVGRGTEITPEYCDVTIERWQNLTGKKAKRIKKGK